MPIYDFSQLQEGDTVTFMVTGVIGEYQGTVLKPIGYQNRPELKVTHFRQTVSDDWAKNHSWNGIVLKGDDYVLMDKL